MSDATEWYDPENPFFIKDADAIKTDIVPVGTYTGQISKAELKRSSKKQTPYVNITVQIEHAEDPENAGYEGKFIWNEMYVTPNTGEQVKKAVTNITGQVPVGPIDLTKAPNEWPGFKVRFIVEHDDSSNETKSRINRFLPYATSSAGGGGGASAPVSSGGFSI